MTLFANLVLRTGMATSEEAYRQGDDRLHLGDWGGDGLHKDADYKV